MIGFSVEPAIELLLSRRAGVAFGSITTNGTLATFLTILGSTSFGCTIFDFNNSNCANFRASMSSFLEIFNGDTDDDDDDDDELDDEESDVDESLEE